MASKQLMDYLKTVLELEKIKLETEQVLGKVKSKKYTTKQDSLQAECDDKGSNAGCMGCFGAIVGFALGGFLITGMEAGGYYSDGVFWIIIIACIVGGAIGGWKITKNIAEARTERKNSEIRQINKQITEKNNRNIAEANKKNQMILTSAGRINMALKDTEQKLKILYAQNLLYPKYQNIVAVSSIYEYLDSGRCDSLDGPNGAYNIYEMELRLDKIITKMDVIISSLNQIMANQYYLYSAIKEIKPQIERISNDIVANTEKLNEIAVNTEVTAYTAKVIERNQYYERNWNNGRGFFDRVNL